jgi:hypothetical protein
MRLIERKEASGKSLKGSSTACAAQASFKQLDKTHPLTIRDAWREKDHTALSHESRDR